MKNFHRSFNKGTFLTVFDFNFVPEEIGHHGMLMLKKYPKTTWFNFDQVISFWYFQIHFAVFYQWIN